MSLSWNPVGKGLPLRGKPSTANPPIEVCLVGDRIHRHMGNLKVHVPPYWKPCIAKALVGLAELLSACQCSDQFGKVRVVVEIVGPLEDVRPSSWNLWGIVDDLVDVQARSTSICIRDNVASAFPFKKQCFFFPRQPLLLENGTHKDGAVNVVDEEKIQLDFLRGSLRSPCEISVGTDHLGRLVFDLVRLDFPLASYLRELDWCIEERIIRNNTSVAPARVLSNAAPVDFLD